MIEVGEEVEAELHMLAVGQPRPPMSLNIARGETVTECAAADAGQDRPSRSQLGRAEAP